MIIPGHNDSEEDIRAFSDWVAEEVGNDTPVHFSRFFPHYRMKRAPPTSIDAIRRAVKIAKEEGVKYVYAGNVPGDPSESTYCPTCGTLLIRRYGFSVEKCNLTEDKRCPNCSELIPIVGECSRSKGFPFLL
ncbi:MAG: hypothetical protein NZ992_04720 [Candidatus Korarchaeum sp.]|nr:hypothetical protein [Candidatus Korarchaeum sp.]